MFACLEHPVKGIKFSKELKIISEKVVHNERLSKEDGIRLFESSDLLAVALWRIMRELTG